MSCQLSTIAEFMSRPAAAGLDSGRFAIVSMGANLASGCRSPRDTLAAAVERLQELSAHPLVLSSIIETEPLDCPPGSPPFLNAVLAFYPYDDATPEQTLRFLLALEADLGRVRSGLRNEARVIDLDLIAFAGELRQTPQLTLPHPRAAQRGFVLAPLAAIWPAYCLPGQHISVRQLLESL